MSYTDHPDYRGLLRAICTTPADDLPRLVMADWLDEHAGVCEDCGGKLWHRSMETITIGNSKYVRPSGELPRCHTCYGTGTNGAAERAEFIRLQIESSRTENVADAFELEYPCLKLLESLPPWATGLGRSLGTGRDYVSHGYGGCENGMRWEWHRGFISEVRCTLAQFERHAAKIAAEHPIEKWVITDAERFVIADSEPRFIFDLSTPIMWKVFYQDDANKTLFSRGIHSRPHVFTTREAAIEALQKACYCVARQRAGLESDAAVNHPTSRAIWIPVAEWVEMRVVE